MPQTEPQANRPERVTFPRSPFDQIAYAELTAQHLGDALLRLRKAVDTMQLGVTITDVDGVILYTNPADAAMHGYTVDELLGQPVAVLAPANQMRPMTRDQLLEVQGWERDTLNVRKDGSTFPVRLKSDVVKNSDGAPIGIVTTCEDITERKVVERQLRESAVRDPLTKLPNRTLLQTVLQRAIGRRLRRRDYLFAVLFLDMDRFKVVNESLGHAAGDELLVAVAERLKPHFRPSDTLARLGGDEFAVLLDDLGTESDAIRIAERVHASFDEPITIGGKQIFISISIGIAFSDQRYREPVEMLRDADIAMYRAKGIGVGHSAVFDAEMHAGAVAQLQLETDLRWGIERGEFQTFYQPILSLRDSRVVGFEALVRWHHPTRGLLAPAQFINVAEETGLIAPMGWWVMRDACRQVREWQNTFPDFANLAVTINCSGKQLTTPDMAVQVAQTLRDTGLDPTALRLEITETLLVEYSDRALELLELLRSFGIQLYIDDFGTGYSSLSYLHQFPIGTVKVDRSFVSTMDTRAESAAIVRSILDLARNLGMSTVAEGVETGKQMRLLRELGCDYAQGHHIAAPLSPAGAEAFLRFNS